MRWWEFGAYLMDDYRVSSKLTLNLGLRYDVYTPMVEEHNRLANFDFQTGLFVAPGVTPGTSRSGNVATNWKNFSPRIGFAYTPGSDNKTSVRGGYGIFYDMQADQNDTELAYNDLPGVYGSQSFTASLVPLTPVMYLSQGPPPIIFSEHHESDWPRQRRLLPQSHDLYPGMEPEHRAPAHEGHGAPGGIRRDARRAPDLPEKSQPGHAATGPNFSDSYGNEGRPYESTVPNIAAIRTEGHDISLINHGLQVRFEKRSSHGWSMLNSYTWQHTIGQATESETPNSDGEPQDTYNMRAERGNVAPDFRHQFTSAWSYEVPFGPGKRFFNGSGPTRWLAGGWQLNGIISLYSGQAFTPYLSYDPTNTGSGGPRPDLVGNPYSFSNAA